MGQPHCRAQFKSSAEDFCVEEQLSVEFSGDGEFDWLWLEKRHITTNRLAELLARHAGIKDSTVSWSGLKDSLSMSRQWLCVHLPGKNVDWSAFSAEGVEILRVERHRKKLRTGTHRSNQFELQLRDVEGDRDALDAQLQSLCWVPNYFGEQRFGRDGSNIQSARDWFEGRVRKPGRFKKGIYLSAARAFLFNEVLAARVEAGSWQQALAGELLMLSGSNSFFVNDGSEEIAQRLLSGDIQPSGPMYGSGDAGLQDEALILEQAVLQQHQALCDGLERQRLDMARRSLWLVPQGLEWQWRGEALSLKFSLNKGCFATALVRELCLY